jgi:hypothetical protein
MSTSFPSFSSRLVRAATAERADLSRHRERLMGEHRRLLDELHKLEDALAAADQRLNVLARLIDEPPSDAGPAEEEDTPAGESDPARDQESDLPRDQGATLRGPAIREVAVQVLVAQPEHIEALHYRRWYELVCSAGHTIAGKDPAAVFLTQLSRSPVVRKATEPGVYELDRQAPLRIRQRLERLQAELREVTVAPQAPVELAAVRARRHELDLAISHQERALEEALRVLRWDEPAAVPALGAR